MVTPGLKSHVEEQLSQQYRAVAESSFILLPAQDYSFMTHIVSGFEEHTQNIAWQRAEKFVEPPNDTENFHF